ncbi:transposase [Planctomicrobium sp. SH668]|uniref:transposase n=1 Tax=Planctomicrobium sp. SH668 TaxID=3448126 RepID=UPI003F5B627D
MPRPRGRAPCGERLVCHTPFGHWKSATFLVGLRLSGLTAPPVIAGAVNDAVFVNYVRQHLAPTLGPGGILIMDDLTSHKVSGDVKRSRFAEHTCSIFLPTVPI